MDDFNNFFDDQRQPESEHTPQYHTPTPKNHDKLNATSIICIVLAVAMCVVVLVNVVVLAALKESIAEEYASNISESMREQYRSAINDALGDTDVIDDVTKAATQSALNRLNYAVGQIADKYCSASVARLYLYTTKTSNLNNYSGSATGFLITDTDESGTVQRYMLTNAHCATYVAETTTSTGRPFWGSSQTQYEWKEFAQIYAYFDGEDTAYELEIVAYGSYYDSDSGLQGKNSKGGSNQADIALLRIKGTQPSNDKHPSLEICEGNDVGRGDPVALIGNPETIGERNSITTGTVSQTDIALSDWGDGTFLMTDAAVNSGNSGGPMINVMGQVVGIVESKLADESIDNMGFALNAQTIIDFIKWAEQEHNITVRYNQ